MPSEQGSPLYLLFLEFGPRKEVVEWAKNYVSNNPNNRFILINHEYLESGGGRRFENLKCVNRLRNTSHTTPEELWKDLIKCNNNIVCVLCGHVDSLYAFTSEKNDYNNDVLQMEFNLQTEQYRTENWLMLWEFPETSDSVNVALYNVKSHCYIDNTPFMAKFKYR